MLLPQLLKYDNQHLKMGWTDDELRTTARETLFFIHKSKDNNFLLVASWMIGAIVSLEETVSYKKNNKAPRWGNSTILEPSAGRGDLLAPYYIKNDEKARYVTNVDAVEVDFDHQATLRGKGYSVVGHDFLQFTGGKLYIHIIMNPPFAEGAKHVLHAWEILREGELVTLVNAETLKNPCDKYRTQLAKIIEDNNGTIEYVSGAFETDETKRKTTVECAIIHLIKTADYSDLAFLDNLKPDLGTQEAIIEESKPRTELALKEDTIKQIVTIFNAAVTAMGNEERVVAKMQAESNYYAGLLTDSILRPKKFEMTAEGPIIESSIESYNSRYNHLKEKAWSHVLEITEVGKSLPSKIKKSINKKFEDVVKLEFTAANIHGFLLGLIQGRPEINRDILLGMFDKVTDFSTGNRAWYKGWKSNDKHKTNAYRIKMTRFILPRRRNCSYMDYETLQELKDIDIAFSLLDGVPLGSFKGITNLFSNEESFKQLCQGERLSSEYFDIRYYHIAGTIHYFPRNKKLIDRLNQFVGRHRQWLPPEGEKLSKAFWLQYNRAEEITRKMDQEGSSHLDYAYGINNGEKADEISVMIDKAGKKLNIPMDNFLSVDKEDIRTSTNIRTLTPNNKPTSRTHSTAKKSVKTEGLETKIQLLKNRYSLPSDPEEQASLFQ